MLQNKHFQMFYPFTIKDHDLAEIYSIETINCTQVQIDRCMDET